MLPDHTRRLAERQLAAFCAASCLGRDGGRAALGFEVGPRAAVIFERRAICGVPGALLPVPVARLAFTAADGTWRLYGPVAYADGAAGFRRRARDRSLARLLAWLDADRDGDFWPQVNGASLRFCSARGRCAGCARAFGSSYGA